MTSTLRGRLGWPLLGSVVALGLAAPAAIASENENSAKVAAQTPRAEALKKCNDDYNAAIKAANALKGKARADAKAKARADHKQCIANAPK